MSTAVVASQVPQVEPSSSGKLDWHIVLESLTDSQVAASIAELPDCKVIAVSRDEAIAAVRSALDERLGAIALSVFSGGAIVFWGGMAYDVSNL
jgi:hypothetical protein